MKILMLARHNLESLGGGDKVQLMKTKDALEELGHQVVVSPRYVGDISRFDLVHLFNIQINPHSFLIYLVQAKRAGKPVAVSTIYWNPEAWKSHADSRVEQGPSPLKSLFTYRFKGIPPLVLFKYFLISPEVRRWLYLLIRQPNGGAASAYTKSFIVGGADIILPNGRAEAEQVRRYIGNFKRCAVVPNGVDTAFAQTSPDDFIKRFGLEDFVLSVGRIETRKNLLALARAAAKLKLPLVLIGNDKLEPEYVKEVRRLGGKDLTVIPEMEHSLLGSAYRAARVHALVSWFETPGLSSLEAAVAGCNIVSTEVGTAREYFEDMAWYCQPDDQDSIENALKSAWEAPKSEQLSHHVAERFSWLEVGKSTEAAYREAMK